MAQLDHSDCVFSSNRNPQNQSVYDYSNRQPSGVGCAGDLMPRPWTVTWPVTSPPTAVCDENAISDDKKLFRGVLLCVRRPVAASINPHWQNILHARGICLSMSAARTGAISKRCGCFVCFLMWVDSVLSGNSQRWWRSWFVTNDDA